MRVDDDADGGGLGSDGRLSDAGDAAAMTTFELREDDGVVLQKGEDVGASPRGEDPTS